MTSGNWARVQRRVTAREDGSGISIRSSGSSVPAPGATASQGGVARHGSGSPYFNETLRLGSSDAPALAMIVKA